MATLTTKPQDIIKFSLMKNPVEFAVSAAVISMILMLIVPLPGVLIDFLLAINIMLSLLVILIALSVKTPTEFTIFPTLLLLTQVFSLALNVSTTRQILAKGPKFDSQIIKAFGEFVVGTKGAEGLAIGIVIFLIIIIVQVVVITKGATRVTEVAARFALDSMQMKQMSIESEFNQGTISEDEMNIRKAELQKELDFYGNMDGAGKFISGGVQAGIFITLVNIIGGIVIGTTIRGEDINSAFSNYVNLTIGDGLVSQLPALLISVATGLLVTRTSGESSFAVEAKKQFINQSRIYWVAGTFISLIGFFPGFPTIIMLTIGAISFYVAYMLSHQEHKEFKDAENDAANHMVQSSKMAEIPPVVDVDILTLELGYGLIPLVDKEQGAELLERVTRIRREAALDLGLVAKPIRIQDNLKLGSNEYRIRLKGAEVGRGELRLDQYMAMNMGGIDEEIAGEATVDPAFNIPAVWIREEARDKAERLGYAVVDSPSILATHLTEVIKTHASELLDRQMTQNILDELRKTYPAVVQAVETVQGYTLSLVQRVLQSLLSEQVSIRNMVVILETLSDYASVSSEIGFLSERIRIALSRQITAQYVDDDKIIRVITVDPSLEMMLIDGQYTNENGLLKSSLSPDQHRIWISSLMDVVAEVRSQNYYPVLLSQISGGRTAIKTSCLKQDPTLTVVSTLEISSDVQIEVLAEVRADFE